MHRTAVREDAHQFLAADARPVAHAADIEMHERRSGSRIETNAAALQAKTDVAQLLQRHAGDEKVHRLAEHVLAELGDAVALPAQHGVGLRRAIAADDVDRLLGSKLALHFPNEIDQVRILRDLFIAAPVAQDVVDLLQRLVVVTAVALVGDGEVFVGVDVVQGDRAGIAFGDRVLQSITSDNESGGGEAETATGTRCEQKR